MADNTKIASMLITIGLFMIGGFGANHILLADQIDKKTEAVRSEKNDDIHRLEDKIEREVDKVRVEQKQFRDEQRQANSEVLRLLAEIKRGQ